MVLTVSKTKILIFGLGAAVLAFSISTIVLAVQKADLEGQTKDLQSMVDYLNGLTRTTTTNVPITTQSTTTTTQRSTTTEAATTTTTTTMTTTTTTQAPVEEVDYRLPGTVIPENYKLLLNPNMDTKRFTGQEVITVNATADVNVIQLHSKDLNISSVYLEDVATTTRVTGYSFDTVREFLVIDLNEYIPRGTQFKIGIIFAGRLDGNVGFYSSSYLKEDGSRKVIATSKFEPTYARESFPCFDEPGMKATYEITLIHPKTGNYSALSNMDVERTVDRGDFVEVYFTKSVPMSTYLTCFIVSDFLASSTTVDSKGIGNNFTISVYATPQQINKVDFALDVGKSVIEYYIDYFQIPYPLPKLDMAAIPDFVSGAMETWGLVTYRETSLLYQEGISSTTNKQRVAGVIAHEFAHMWFGNLVTMQWWNDLWLNEGFADFIEFKGITNKFPEWHMEDQFLVDELHPVLTTDASSASHPIIQTVSNPDQITEIFDTITYNKGSSIIRMMENFLTSAIFEKAVTNYLNKYKYKNAVTSYFMTEIDNLNPGVDVPAIMRTWTEQMGYPVVEVTQNSATQYTLTQKRFLSNPDEYQTTYNDSSFNYRWSIPVTYITNSSAEPQYNWFYYDQQSITITLPESVAWIKFNSKQVGFYRVNYPRSLWENLANVLVSTPEAFSVSDRAHLLNDAFALADASQLEYEVALEMTRYLNKEADYVPWDVAYSQLSSIYRRLVFTDANSDYVRYVRALVKPIYEQVTWNVGSDHMQNLLRIDILNFACSMGLPDCLNEASSRLRSYLSDTTTRLHPDLASTIYFYGMKESDEEMWEQMWQLFINEQDASEKSRLMNALAAVQNPVLLQRYIILAENENYVRQQDYFTCLGYISNNRIGQPLVWDYVREHWLELVDRFGLNERYLGRLIPTITRRFDTQTKLEEMQAFFAKYPEAGAGASARQQALATVRTNIAWLENNLSKLASWLQAQTGN